MMKNYSGSAHNVAVEGGDIGASSSAASHDTKDMSMAPSFTQEHFDKLLILIQSSSVNHGSIPATSNQ
ncbi:hypothetical protein A2U01_0097338, partial [Trifolium medium]|nr:hypothetical protein [Trifolium medium]